jgi:hypothetical protein
MRQRRITLFVVALLVSTLALVAACGGGAPPPNFAGTDNEDSAPPEARDVILNGLETMFTWSPETDASSADAYRRALPFLGKDLTAGASNRIERGNSPAWQAWKAQHAKVTAKALLVSAEHPQDKPDTVQRSVVLTQTVTAPDGRELDSTTFNIDRVVAKKGPQGWKVEQIAFFPENPTQTPTCPPGQSHQPPPDGPCAPNPPPPPKQCADGAAVAPDQACPPAQTGPKTRACPNGTVVPAGSACPSTRPSAGPNTGPPPSQSTPGSTTVESTPPPTTPSSTPASSTPTTECPDGQTRYSDGTCQLPPCPSGQTRDSSGTCQLPPCPSGQTRDSSGTCQLPPCPSGQTRDSSGTCQLPPCPSGQTRNSSGTCAYPPCPVSGQSRNSSGTCVCPPGEVVQGGVCDIHVASWHPTISPPTVKPLQSATERTEYSARSGGWPDYPTVTQPSGPP